MKILVDADACPVKHIIEKVAKEYVLPVYMFIDTSHILTSDYSEIITVSQAPDAVDFALMNQLSAGDIVVTQDYGVAAMALGKKAYAIHNSGRIYTDENINQMLFERHISKKQRAQGRMRGKIKKREEKDDIYFEKNLRIICQRIQEGEE